MRKMKANRVQVDQVMIWDHQQVPRVHVEKIVTP